MLTDDELAALEAAWAPARSAGVLGSTSATELWEHTAGFTSAVCSCFSAPADGLALRVIDVGTGAGVPGLLLARQLPASSVTLVDGAERRLDHVRRARRSLGVEAQTTVVHGRAEVLGHSPGFRESFDVAVARLLAEPAEAAELLLPFVRDGGVLVVSVAERSLPTWKQLPIAGVPLGPAKIFGSNEWFVAVERQGPLDASIPRTTKKRRREPLLR